MVIWFRVCQPSPPKESGLIAAKLEMLMAISEVFGEQKIDILVRSRNQKSSAIQEIAKFSGKELTL